MKNQHHDFINILILISISAELSAGSLKSLGLTYCGWLRNPVPVGNCRSLWYTVSYGIIQGKTISQVVPDFVTLHSSLEFGRKNSGGILKNHPAEWLWMWFITIVTLSIYRFPEIGVPLVIIHLNGIFPNKNHPAIGVPPWLWKPPFIDWIGLRRNPHDLLPGPKKIMVSEMFAPIHWVDSQRSSPWCWVIFTAPSLGHFLFLRGFYVSNYSSTMVSLSGIGSPTGLAIGFGITTSSNGTRREPREELLQIHGQWFELK